MKHIFILTCLGTGLFWQVQVTVLNENELLIKYSVEVKQ